MNRAPWIVLAYGYVVCLVAVITLIVNVDNFVDAVFDRSHPLQSRVMMYGGLQPFEVYQASPPQVVQLGPGPGEPARSRGNQRCWCHPRL